jgi:hypothetical protein
LHEHFVLYGQPTESRQVEGTLLSALRESCIDFTCVLMLIVFLPVVYSLQRNQSVGCADSEAAIVSDAE